VQSEWHRYFSGNHSLQHAESLTLDELSLDFLRASLQPVRLCSHHNPLSSFFADFVPRFRRTDSPSLKIPPFLNIPPLLQPLYTGREVCRQICDSGATLIFTTGDFAEKLHQAGVQIPVICCGPDHNGTCTPFAEMLSAGTKRDAVLPSGSPDDVLVLPYSSGTTGEAGTERPAETRVDHRGKNGADRSQRKQTQENLTVRRRKYGLMFGTCAVSALPRGR
jgi:hypothetical protein